MVVRTHAAIGLAAARWTAYEVAAAKRTFNLPVPLGRYLDTTPPGSTSRPGHICGMTAFGGLRHNPRQHGGAVCCLCRGYA